MLKVKTGHSGYVLMGFGYLENCEIEPMLVSNIVSFSLKLLPKRLDPSSIVTADGCLCVVDAAHREIDRKNHPPTPKRFPGLNEEVDLPPRSRQ